MANEVIKSFSESLSDKIVAVETALQKEFKRERFVKEGKVG